MKVCSFLFNKFVNWFEDSLGDESEEFVFFMNNVDNFIIVMINEWKIKFVDIGNKYDIIFFYLYKIIFKNCKLKEIWRCFIVYE